MNYTEFLHTSTRRFLLNTTSAVKLINHSQIIYIEADDNYSKIFLEDNSEYLLSKTLRIVEEELNNEMFFRSHRTYLINLLFVKEICKGSEMYLLLKNGAKIPLARRRLCELRKIFSDISKSSVYSES
jgi:two-component system LytT family response regulator